MGKERKLKYVVFEIYRSSRTDNLLMDAPKTKSWRELMHYAADKESCKLENTGEGFVSTTCGERVYRYAC